MTLNPCSEENGFPLSRRELIKGAMAVTVAELGDDVFAQPTGRGPRNGDRVFLTNEDSCTLSVIDPVNDIVLTTINLTSFDEDSRPPFRFVTGGAMPSHSEMLQKPLYHGAVSVHGCAPSPDSNIVAVAGRGSSNIYFVDTRTLKILGNQPNPLAGPATSPEQITSGIFVGREPHEPTFTPTGKEVFVAVRGENRIAVVDVGLAMREMAGEVARGASLRRFIPTVPGPSMVWFGSGGNVAVIASQRVPRVHVLTLAYDAQGNTRVTGEQFVELGKRDPFGFSPFVRRARGRDEFWITHKLADSLSSLELRGGKAVLTDHIMLGDKARPNHVEFIENTRGKAIYISFARLDQDASGGEPSSKLAIIDLSSPPGQRRVVGHVFSGGREAHGMWTDPDSTKLYVAHELDDLPQDGGMPRAMCSVFDVTDPFAPKLITRISLGGLVLPSGTLRNKKSINLLYVRPGAPSAAAVG